ncbi:MAG TPA: superinfection immunity protein [Actinomycetes bacterium]|nr:superinfection immunity protein [Actinomycetes bacterium]
MVVVAWVIALLTGFYMLPWAVAVTRALPNRNTILWINLLLGWTIIGWIVALVMSCSQPKTQ